MSDTPNDQTTDTPGDAAPPEDAAVVILGALKELEDEIASAEAAGELSPAMASALGKLMRRVATLTYVASEHATATDATMRQVIRTLNRQGQVLTAIAGLPSGHPGDTGLVGPDGRPASAAPKSIITL